MDDKPKDAQVNASVNFLYRTMLERDPRKRRVKPVGNLEFDFTQLEDSSDDSDFQVKSADENNSDSNASGSDSDDSDKSSGSDSGGSSQTGEEEESGLLKLMGSAEKGGKTKKLKVKDSSLKEARAKQAQARQRIASKLDDTDILKVKICTVCLGDISIDNDEIVECDGCGLYVHEGCYGISDSDSVQSTVSSYSTEPWFCDACVSGNNNITCELCPNLGGIFKRTDVDRYIHLVCALYTPGVAFGDVEKLSPVTLFELPVTRWGAKACCLCEDEYLGKTGVCINCDAGMCRNYFHATCAQREGLLSEALPEEIKEIADPFFAYCKQHANREIARRKHRNWLASQTQTKISKENKFKDFNKDYKDRLERKLNQKKDKQVSFRVAKPLSNILLNNKVPRMLNTSPYACMKLLAKARFFGMSELINSPDMQVVDVHKKWHISPAFSLEFVAYYKDRVNRTKGLEKKLDELIGRNNDLQLVEQETRQTFDRRSAVQNTLDQNSKDLRKKMEVLYSIISQISHKKLSPPKVFLTKVGSPAGKNKLALVSYAGIKRPKEKTPHLTMNKCSTCRGTKDQHLLTQCDSCKNFYHLSCLNPPLTRMPKRTKLQGWQCSECNDSDESESESEMEDLEAPRKLRRSGKFDTPENGKSPKRKKMKV